jgi:N-acetylmuramoyl-L-alanine amidase
MTITDLVKLPADMLLARLLYGEARGESIEGKVAVANVVLNRLRSKRWGDTVHSVILQPKQFSCFNPNDGNLPKLLMVNVGAPVFVECLTVARSSLLGLYVDNTQGADHYHTKGSDPAWDDKMRRTAEIAGHVFYKSNA